MVKKLTRIQLEEEINKKAWKDAAFKKKLLSHPLEALKEFGLNLPPHTKIYIHEEDGTSFHFTLRKAPLNSKNLSDDELNRLAGGGCMGTGSVCGGP